MIAKGSWVHRRLRDAAGTAAVLMVLFGTVMAVSPALRERVTLIADGQSDQLAGPRSVVSKAMNATGATAVRYAGNNTYLVFFLIVAGLLFILMLRA